MNKPQISPIDEMKLRYGTSVKKVKIVKQSEDKPLRKQNEWHEQLVFCKYIAAKYPDVEFKSDLASAGAKTPHMQNLIKILHSNSGWPDTKIFEPKQGFCGLMIEIKKVPKSQGYSIYKADGTFKKSEHIENQVKMHEKLRTKGWYIRFAEGADEAISILDSYMKGEFSNFNY
jgi:hypothetical protein